MSAQTPRPAKSGTPSANIKWLIGIMIGVVLVGALVAVLAIRAAGLANSPGFFGTRAGLLADINFSLEILLLAGLTFGYMLARRGNISAHQYNQTAWVLFNIILVEFIMAVSFTQQVAPGIPAKLNRPYYWLAALHTAVGGLTVLGGVYILLRMNKLLPKRLRISWWKSLMRATLVGYWLVGLLGAATYFAWYTAPPQATGAPAVAQNENSVVVPMANYEFVPVVLTIPVGTKVIFINQDPAPHTVTFDNNEYPAMGFDEGGTDEIAFDKIGAFQYYCEYHGSPGVHDMAGVINVVGAEQAAVVPTAAAPPQPTPQPTAPAVAAEPLGPIGFGEFRDEAARSDAFELMLSRLPSGVQGEMQAWLVGTAAPLRLGKITADASGKARLTYADPQRANLVASYSQFVVSVESAGAAPGAPSSRVLLTGDIPAGALPYVRALLVASDAAPKNQALAVALLKEAEELFRHTRAVHNAALVGDFGSLNRHGEHMLTLIEGKGGPNYRDFDGDGFVTDPGDGFGILNYAQAVEDEAKAAASAPDATESVKLHAGHLVIVAGNIRDWALAIDQLLIQAHQATTAADQQSFTQRALTLSMQLLNGVDANGSGEIEPAAGEGGAYTTYFHSQYLAAMGAAQK